MVSKRGFICSRIHLKVNDRRCGKNSCAIGVRLDAALPD